MIKLFFEILFYLTVLILAVYSLIMIYALLRFGESKILGLVMSTIYLFLMFSLFTAALLSFQNIPFNQTSF